MLSKLRHFSSDNAGDLAVLRSRVDVRPALVAIGASAEAPIVAVNGGTLGVGFIATVDDRQRFLKTCASTDGAANLEKEIRILTHLYGDALSIRRIQVPQAGAPSRVWLEMDVLQASGTPLIPIEARNVVASYRSRLASLPEDFVGAADTLGTLIELAVEGLVHLSVAGQICAAMHDNLHQRLAYLAREWFSFPRVICHGDLGPRNIMKADGRVVVIDWEDAFVGVPGYDFLYWLTFFENRRHYHKDNLGHTPLGVEVEVAMLAMILVLKSDLAFRAHTLVGNQLSVEQRIGEVLALA